MSDDNVQPNKTDQPRQTEQEQVSEQTEQSQGIDRPTGPPRSSLGARTQAAVRKLKWHAANAARRIGGIDFVCAGPSSWRACCFRRPLNGAAHHHAPALFASLIQPFAAGNSR